MKKTKIVGITGGIGTGKTTIAKVFASMGVPLYNADERTRLLMQTNQSLIDQMVAHFGKDAYLDNNILNRKYIANIVFKDKTQLEKLNSIVHPHSINDANVWAAAQQTAYVLKEAALLFETEAFHHVDYIIGVTAPTAIRIHRVMKRDGITRDEVIERMQNQIPDAIKMKLCDAVISNDDMHLVTPQVVHLHQQLSLL